MPSLESYKYRDCLITLNEMVSHQEVKMHMVESELVSISSEFLSSTEEAIRRESVLLLGSMFSLMKARSLATPSTYQGLINML
jgi:ACT domain-containing protein